MASATLLLPQPLGPTMAVIPVSSEDYFGVVGEGFKPGDFQTLEFEHLLVHSSCFGPASAPVGRAARGIRTGEPL